MKICPKCNTGNRDDAMHCIECHCSLANVPQLNSEEVLDKAISENTRRENRNRRICYALGAAYGIFALAVFVASLFVVSIGVSLLFGLVIPGLGVFAIFFPGVGFSMRMEYLLANSQGVEPSEYYLFVTRLSGVFLALFSSGTLLYLMLYPNIDW